MLSTTALRPQTRRRRRLIRASITLGLCLLWILLVLYPNPTLLPRAIANAYEPKIDPEAVRHWADQLPDDPAYIERQVEGTLLPYAVPWETYGVPWYYPTTREVVEKGVADCQGRMLVFASILEAKGIPYQLRASIDHIWVEYEHKQETRIENAAIAVMDNGQLTIPETWDWRESYEIEKEYFWDTAPTGRKLLLFVGLAAIVFRRRIVSGVTRLHAGLAPTRPALVEQLLDTVAAWEAEGRLSINEAHSLRARLTSREVADVAPHLGAHVTMGVLLPFPFASIARSGWTLLMLLGAALRWLGTRIDRAALGDAWRMHHPLVALLAAVPVIGSLAYLLATRQPGNRLLLRVAVHTGLSRMPWRLYERTGSRRLVLFGRPMVRRQTEPTIAD